MCLYDCAECGHLPSLDSPFVCWGGVDEKGETHPECAHCMKLFHILTQDHEAAFLDTVLKPEACTTSMEVVDEQIMSWLERDWKSIHVKLYKPFQKFV